jgi:hypothetical protein
VRRLFQVRADGYGLTRITKQLKAEGATAPRTQQRRPTAWSLEQRPRGAAPIADTLYRGEVT